MILKQDLTIHEQSMKILCQNTRRKYDYFENKIVY